MLHEIGNDLHEWFWRSAYPAGVRQAGIYHRTIATYLNAPTGCGPALDLVDEPGASSRPATDQPVYQNVPDLLRRPGDQEPINQGGSALPQHIVGLARSAWAG